MEADLRPLNFGLALAKQRARNKHYYNNDKLLKEKKEDTVWYVPKEFQPIAKKIIKK